MAKFLKTLSIITSVFILYIPSVYVAVFYSENHWQQYGRPIIVIGSTIILFVIRIRAKAIYGLVEVIFGSTIAMNFVPEKYEGLQSLLDIEFIAFLGGVYIGVRGWDNIDKAVTSEWDEGKLGRVRKFIYEAWTSTLSVFRPDKVKTEMIQPSDQEKHPTPVSVESDKHSIHVQVYGKDLELPIKNSSLNRPTDYLIP